MRQVLDYVVRGEVTAGLVYVTDARVEKDNVEIVATAEDAWHQPIEYPAAVLKASRQTDLAERFVNYLGKQKAQGVLARSGFSHPQPPASRPAIPGSMSSTSRAVSRESTP